jgi:predicted nucleotidyltransferase
VTTHTDFKRFIELLNDAQVKYLIVGGYAYAIHKEPRYTGDIDFFILADLENAESVLSALKRFGFDLATRADDLSKQNKMITLGNAPYRIDILTSIDGVTFEEAWKHRVRGDFEGAKAWYISREHLIANKIASGRPKDIADVKGLRKKNKRHA